MIKIEYENHHYVPQFLLRKWCDKKDGKMWYYRKVYNGKIVGKRINPKSTCFETNLNSLKTAPPPFGNVPDDRIIVVEDKLKRIDSDAANILNKMINDGITSLSQEEKNIWLHFIVLLAERNPSRLTDVTSSGNSILDKTVSDCIEKWGNKNIWLETKKILEDTHFTSNQARVRLYELINNFSNIMESDLFEWRICDLTATPIDLFITDLPVIYNLDEKISDHIRFIQLAITPKHLFIGAQKNFAFNWEMLRDLSILYNVKILMLGPKYVCSKNQIVDEYHFKYQKLLGQYLKEEVPPNDIW